VAGALVIAAMCGAAVELQSYIRSFQIEFTSQFTVMVKANNGAIIGW
jgi:hypothetical protein